MHDRKLQPGWPTRTIDIAVGDHRFGLIAPDNPYSLLDLPAVEAAFKHDEYMPYWAHLWPGALMLSQWLIDHQHDPAVPSAPASVLELGCGLGVPSLIAARLGYQVTASDYDGDALEYLNRNARLLSIALRTRLIDWRVPPPDRYPLILAADVLYEARVHQPILECLRMTLKRDGLAVLTDPNRRTADAFIRDAARAGWDVQVSATRWEEKSGRAILLRRDRSANRE
jgi:predicted nicotinamide N-methyase